MYLIAPKKQEEQFSSYKEGDKCTPYFVTFYYLITMLNAIMVLLYEYLRLFLFSNVMAFVMDKKHNFVCSESCRYSSNIS